MALPDLNATLGIDRRFPTLAELVRELRTLLDVHAAVSVDDVSFTWEAQLSAFTPTFRSVFAQSEASVELSRNGGLLLVRVDASEQQFDLSASLLSPANDDTSIKPVKIFEMQDTVYYGSNLDLELQGLFEKHPPITRLEQLAKTGQWNDFQKLLKDETRGLTPGERSQRYHALRTIPDRSVDTYSKKQSLMEDLEWHSGKGRTTVKASADATTGLSVHSKNGLTLSQDAAAHIEGSTQLNDNTSLNYGADASCKASISREEGPAVSAEAKIHAGVVSKDTVQLSEDTKLTYGVAARVEASGSAEVDAKSIQLQAELRGEASIGAAARVETRVTDSTLAEVGVSCKAGAQGNVTAGGKTGFEAAAPALAAEARVDGSVTTQVSNTFKAGVHGAASVSCMGYTIDVGAHGAIKKVNLLEKTEQSGNGTVKTLNGYVQGGEVKYKKTDQGYFWHETETTEVGVSLTDGIKFRWRQRDWEISENVKQVGKSTVKEASFVVVDLLFPEGESLESVAKRMQQGAQSVTVTAVATFGGDMASRVVPETVMNHVHVVMGELAKAGSAEALIAHSKQVLFDESAQQNLCNLKSADGKSGLDVSVHGRLIVTEKSTNGMLKEAISDFTTTREVNPPSPFGVHHEVGVRVRGETTVGAADDVKIGGEVNATMQNFVCMVDAQAHAEVRTENSWTKTESQGLSGKVETVAGRVAQVSVGHEHKQHHMFSRETVAQNVTAGVKRGLGYETASTSINALQDTVTTKSYGVGWTGLYANQTVLSRGFFVDSTDEASWSWWKLSWEEKRRYHLNQNSLAVGQDVATAAAYGLIDAFESGKPVSLETSQTIVAGTLRQAGRSAVTVGGMTALGRMAPNLMSTAGSTIQTVAPALGVVSAAGQVVNAHSTYKRNVEAVGVERAWAQAKKDAIASLLISGAASALATAARSNVPGALASAALGAVYKKASGADKDGVKVVTEAASTGFSPEQDKAIALAMGVQGSSCLSAPLSGLAAEENKKLADFKALAIHALCVIMVKEGNDDILQNDMRATMELEVLQKLHEEWPGSFPDGFPPANLTTEWKPIRKAQVREALQELRRVVAAEVAANNEASSERRVEDGDGVGFANDVADAVQAACVPPSARVQKIAKKIKEFRAQNMDAREAALRARKFVDTQEKHAELVAGGMAPNTAAVEAVKAVKNVAMKETSSVAHTQQKNMFCVVM